MLYISGIILAFFLSLILVTKRNKTAADYILVAWLFFTGLILLTHYLFITKQYEKYPSLVVSGFSIPLLVGPFLYIYTMLQTIESTFKKKILLHFIPFIVSLLLYADFYFLPFERQVEIFRQSGQGYEGRALINLAAIYLSGIIYVWFALRALIKYKKNIVQQFSNTEKINFNWLLYLIIWIGAIWVVILFTRNSTFIFSSIALFVLWLGHFGIRQVNVFSQNYNAAAPVVTSKNEMSKEIITEVIPPATIEPESMTMNENIDSSKYQKSSLSDEEAESIHDRLIKIMEEKKPYTNPDLTLTDLAKSLDVHPNYLSQVINSKEKKPFYDLINERRVKEFIVSVSQPYNQQFTLLALAYDCGFNSKASFNRNFKKHTGLTPTDFLKNKNIN